MACTTQRASLNLPSIEVSSEMATNSKFGLDKNMNNEKCMNKNNLLIVGDFRCASASVRRMSAGNVAPVDETELKDPYGRRNSYQ